MGSYEAEKLIRLARHVSEIVSSPADLQKALEATVGIVSSVLEAEGCSVMFTDEDAGVLRLMASTDIDRSLWDTIESPLGEGYAGNVAATGRPLLVRNAAATDQLSEERRRRYTSGSFLCAPMKVRGRTIGVINVTNRRDHQPFTHEQLDAVVSLANLLGLAVDNAHLIERTDAMSRRLRDILEGIGDGIIAADTKGVVMHHNELALHYLGVDTRQCVGRRLSEVVPAGLAALFQELFERAMIERQHIHKECEFVDKGTTSPRPLTLSAAPLYQDACGRLSGVVFAVHDMTLHQKIDELQRIDEAKNSFLAIISHELRTPLTSIKGATHLLRQRLETQIGSENLNLFRIIEQNSERLLRQIINMLDVANIQNQTASVTLRRVSLAAVVRQCAAQYVDHAKQKQIELTENYAHAPGLVQIDEEKIGRAVTHLLDNAIKFTPGGGSVSVAVGQHETEAFVTVRDSGAGIDPALRQRIFHKFVQGEGAMTRQTGGCGIGLYVARAFAELHGGRIETVNLENGGCEFRLVLPLPDSGKACDLHLTPAAAPVGADASPASSPAAGPQPAGGGA
jgi:PAS domain S-box-containing protein